MERATAITNSMAVATYMMTYYSNDIVCYTKYTNSIEVTVHLYWAKYDSKREKEKLDAIVMAGAKIETFSHPEGEFDVIDVTYGLDD